MSKNAKKNWVARLLAHKPDVADTICVCICVITADSMIDKLIDIAVILWPWVSL